MKNAAFHQNEENKGGYLPLSLSAQPDPEATDFANTKNSRLIASFNSDADRSGRNFSELVTPDYRKLTGKYFDVSYDSVFIVNLILAQEAYIAKYPGGVRYDALPTGAAGRSGGQYNSNCYVSGLLKAAGFDFTSIDPQFFQPGRSSPVPIPLQY